MSWWSRTLDALGLSRRDLATDAIGWHDRSGRRLGGATNVSAESALRHSAVWAGLRLRADLISSMPIDVFRKADGVLAEVNKPKWLTSPAPGVDITEWMWSTQCDLDRYGNTFGLITEKDGAGRPSQIELLAASDVAVQTKGRRITGYRVGSEILTPSLIWHEKQYVPAGSPMGLSPIAYAAMSIGGYLSAQQFALDWYSTGAHPTGTLKNTEQAVSQETAAIMKARAKVAMADRDFLVFGKEWEWQAAAGDASSAAFLDEMAYGITDVCRFLGIPADMIDAPAHGSSVTYANVTQRNLQLLVVNLGPAIARREHALSAALSNPRIVKLNTDSVLRMDPLTRAQVLAVQVANRAITPSEWRALDNRAPLTDEQVAEIDHWWPAKQVTDTSAQERLGYHFPPYAGMPVVHAYATDLTDIPRERAAITSGWTPPSEGTDR